MNKLLTKIAASVLGLSMAIGVGVAAGSQNGEPAKARAAITDPDDSVTFSDKYSANTTLDGTTITVGDSTVVFNKRSGGTATQYYTNGTSVRWYGGGTLVVSSSSKTIEAIDITYTRSDNTISANVGTWSSPSWTGSSSSVTFTQGGTSGHLRVSTIAIKYASSGGGSDPVQGTLTITPVNNDNELEVGATGTFAYTLTGGTHSELTTVMWGSDDTTVLTVDENTGEYEAVGEGNATITLMGDDGDFDDYEATYDIEVVPPAPKYTDDTTNKTITWDLSVDSTETASTTELSWTSPKVSVVAAKAGAGTDTNNYYPGKAGQSYTSTRFYKNSTLTFTPASGYKITSIVVQATSLNYANALGDSTWTNATASANTTSFVVTITPTNQKNAVSATISATAGVTSIVVYYGIASSATLSGIALSGTYQTTFKQGDSFSHEGMIVTATYSDNSEVDVTASATWTGYDMTTAGNQTVTVSFTDGSTKTATYNIYINESIILSCENISIAVSEADVTPVVKIQNTDTVVNDCTFTSSDDSIASIVSNKVHAVAAGSATITASHASEGGKEYTSATFTVTVVEISSIQTVVTACSALSGTAVAPGTYTIQGTVTGNYSSSTKKNYMIQQGAYGMYLYNTGIDLNEGDVVRATGTFGKYNNWIESRSLTSVTKINTAAESISPVTISDVSSLTDAYQNRVVSFTGLTYDSGTYSVGSDASITFKLGNTELVLRTTGGIPDETNINSKLDQVFAAKDTATFNLVGVHYTVFNSAKQFKVDNASKIQIISNTATPKEIVQGFVDDCMHMEDIPVSESSRNSETTNCSRTGGYYEVAKAALTILDPECIALFQSDSDFDDAQERYESWAEIYGDTTPYSTEITRASKNLSIGGFDSNSSIMIITLVSLISISSFGAFLFLRKRKEQ